MFECESFMILYCVLFREYDRREDENTLRNSQLMSRLGLSESRLNNLMPLSRESFLQESHILRSQNSMDAHNAKSSIDCDDEDIKQHGAFAFGKVAHGDDFTTPMTQNFLPKRGFGFPFQNKLGMHQDLGYGKVATSEETHFNGTNPYVLHNTNDTVFHPTLPSDDTIRSPFFPLRANPISYDINEQQDTSYKMEASPSSSTFNESIQPMTNDLNSKRMDPAMNNFGGVWSRAGYEKANDTKQNAEQSNYIHGRIDNPINVSSSYAFTKASPIRNTIRQPNRSIMHETQIPAALRSVLQHENIDYENDFYWMAKFKRDRLTDPVGLEKSCLNSKMMLSGMNSFNPIRGLSGSTSIFSDDGDISMSSLINQSSADFPFHPITFTKPNQRNQDDPYINQSQESV
jgi:hypothetical protein